MADKQLIEKITTLRLRLLDNGYTPLRNVDKRCMMKGWPTAEITEQEIRNWGRRHSRDIATGLRIENGLAAIDIDIDDADVMKQVTNAIFDAVPLLDDEDVPWLVRHGKGAKEAWFVRTDEEFGRIHSRGFTKPGETPDEGVHRVEIFGGGMAREFGAYGPHSYGEDGQPTVLYRWANLGPMTVPLRDLPVLTKKDFWAITDAISAVLIDNGWEPVLASKQGESKAERLYDILPDMVFDCNDGQTRTLDEARLYAADGGVRCSFSFIEGSGAINRERCLMSLTHSGALQVWETAADVMHTEATDMPASKQVILNMDRVSEKFREIDEKRKQKIKGSDEMEMAARKMRAGFAYWPRGGQGGLAVPIWASSMDVGTPITAFRTQHLPNCQVEVGPRGGEKKINPVDVWLGDHQRKTIDGLRMRPDMPRPTFEENGLLYVNVYDPPIFFESEKGDAQPGIDFITHLVPDKEERDWFLQWLSYKLRMPHIPGPAVVMVAHGTFGTGRGTLYQLIGKLLGPQYVHALPFSDLTGGTNQSIYNEWAAEALMVVVNESSEVHTGSKFRAKSNAYEHLKELVDPRPSLRSIKVKSRPNYRALSSTTFLIATNHADALPIPESDRRFCVITNGGTKPVEYWEALNAWMEDDRNVGAFFDWLAALDISAYSPFEAPPVFEGKARMVEEGLSDLDRAISLAEEEITAALFVPSQMVAAVIKTAVAYDLTLPEVQGQRLNGIIKSTIRRKYYRAGAKNGPGYHIVIDGVRQGVYAKTQERANAWKNRSAEDKRREALRNGLPGKVDVQPQSNVVALQRLKDRTS